MIKIKTAALAAVCALLIGACTDEPAPPTPPTPPVKPQTIVHACPTGQYNANYPGVPEQCVKCAAPGCPSCHSERTKETVADTTAAERNCPPAVNPH